MRTKYVFLLFLLFFGFKSISQEAKPCGQYEAVQKLQNENPTLYASMMEGKTPIDENIPGDVEKGTVYTIPVVFHILHNGGSENISEAQILSAMDVINEDFRMLNSDLSDVVPTFQGITADAEIEFALATIAPDGTCFDGITRTQSSATNNGNDGEAQVQAVINGNDVYQGYWPEDEYMNVFVCKELISGAAGYTFNPGGTWGMSDLQKMYYNGVFLLANYTGSIGTSSPFTSRTFTHEAGHWLNLAHTWGEGQIGTCGDDFVSDTPTTEGSNGVCNPSTQKTCDGTLDNVQNYMDYSYCTNMFTQGQVDRMRTAVQSSTAGRNNLWTESNLQATGIISGGGSSCMADIEATETGLCEGNSTVFSIVGVDAPITSYSWTFNGGTPATSSDENPEITYTTSGTYDVSVTYETASGSQTIDATAYIQVASASAGQALPLIEGFTSTTFPPTDWSADNGWEHSNAGTNPSGNGSAKAPFYNGSSGNVIDLNAPTLDFTGQDEVSLTFDVAYSPSMFAQGNDKLEVLVASGCAGEYEVVYSKSGTDLATENESFQEYNSPNSWVNEAVDLSSYIGEDQVKIKFRGTSGGSNNIFIDNVNVIGENTAEADFTVSDDESCMEETVTFTDASIDAEEWEWDFGDGAEPATATGEGPHDVTYSTPGEKEITLTVNGGVDATTKSITIHEAPTVSLSSFPATCVDGDPIVLNQGSPSGGTYSGDGVENEEFNPADAGSGATIITYSYTDDNGCSNEAEVTINVNEDCDEMAEFSFSPTEACIDAEVTFTDESEGADSWEWDFGEDATPQTSSEEGPHDVSYSSSGTKTITLTINGGASTIEHTLKIHENPEVNIQDFPFLCIEDDPIDLSQGEPAGGNYSGEGIENNQFDPQEVGEGITEVVYTYTDENGCTNTATKDITVEEFCTIEADFTPSETEICVGESVTFTDASSGATSWAWNFGNGANPQSESGQGPHTVSYNTAGVKTITLVINNGEDTKEQTITVNEIPTVTLSNFPLLCDEDGPINLTQGMPTGGTYSGTGVSNNQFNPQEAGVGTHEITYEVGGECSASTTGLFVVTDDCDAVEAEANFTFDADGDCDGGQATYTDASVGAFSWSWNFGADATPQTATGQGPHNVSYSSGGIKEVTLTINDGEYEKSEQIQVGPAVNVTLEGLPEIICIYDAIYTFTEGQPAGGEYSGPGVVNGNQFDPEQAELGFNTITYTYTNAEGCSGTATAQVAVTGCASVNEEEQAVVNIYPNPAAELVNIEAPYLLKEIQIYDELGRTVRTIKNIEKETIQINTTNLSPGTYHIQTWFKNRSEVSKLIIR